MVIIFILSLQPTMTYNEEYVMVGDEGSTDVLCWDTRTGVLLKRLPGTYMTLCSIKLINTDRLNSKFITGQNNNVRCVVASPIDDAYLTCRYEYI